MKPKWIPWLFVIAATLFALMFVMNRAQAHTGDEMDLWFKDWAERASNSLQHNLTTEFRTMVEFHPWYWMVPVEAIPHRGVPQNVEAWRPLVAQYFAPGDVNTALCLMGPESEGDPNAYNPRSGASALMQVLASWAPLFGYAPADLFDPSVNLLIASKLRNSPMGWGHWSPYNRGECHGL